MKVDLYELLGVSHSATYSEIKKAYYKKAKEHHPDHGGNEEEMVMLTKAYKVLSDPDRRKIYDETGLFEDARQLTIEEEAINLLAKYIDNLLAKYEHFLPYIHIFKELSATIKENAKNCAKDKKSAEQTLKMIETITSSIESINGKNNIVCEIIKNIGGGASKTIVAANRFLEVSERALELIKEIKYEPMEMTKHIEAELEEFLKPKNPMADMIKNLFG